MAVSVRGEAGCQIISSKIKKGVKLQGASKKMLHSDFSLKSVPGVGFYFFRGVSDSEFCA